MALRAFLSSLNELSDEAKKLYRKEGDGFVLDVETSDGFELVNTTNLKKSLQTERNRAKELDEKIKAFGDATPESVQSALSLVKELDGKPLDKAMEERWKLRETQLSDKHKTEITKHETKISKLLEELQENIITARATQAIAEKKGNVELLLPHVIKHMRMREVDGKHIAQIIDPSTKQERITKKGSSSDAMQLSELMEEFVNSSSFSAAFEGSNASGSGAGGGASGGGKSGNAYTISQEQAKDIRAYKAAKEAAVKQGRDLVITG